MATIMPLDLYICFYRSSPTWYWSLEWCAN